MAATLIKRHRLFWLYLASIILAGGILMLADGQRIKIGRFTKQDATLSPAQNEKAFHQTSKPLLVDNKDAVQLALDARQDGKRAGISVSNTTTTEVNIRNHETKTPLGQQNAVELWGQWKALLHRSELQQIPIINAFLAERLRESPDLSIYQDLRSLLSDPNMPIGNKALILDLLTETATPEALHELLELSGLGAESPLYAFILQSIAHIGDIHWDGRFHEELSPLLENAWADPSITDEQLLTAIGSALAKIGSPSGISLLLDAIAYDRKDTVNFEIDRARQSIAFNSADNVGNAKATQILNDCINQNTAPLSEVCMEGLASIGTPEATNMILDHAELAAGSSARPIADALRKIENDKSRTLVEHAPKTRKFQSPEVKMAVTSVANDMTMSAVVSTTKQ